MNSSEKTEEAVTRVILPPASKNIIIIKESYAEIVLRQPSQAVANVSKIDISSVGIAKLTKWRLNRGYVEGKINKKSVFLHKALCNSHAHVDHINRDPLDNRTTNLRPATMQQNQMNRTVQRNNRLGLKGVTPHRNKFHATIKVKGIKIHIGCFDSAKEAALAYNAEAFALFGEYAWLNPFPSTPAQPQDGAA